MTEFADECNLKPPIATELTEGESYEESETFDPKQSGLMSHAEYELDLIGLGDEDADYGGELKGAIMELIEVFARQGHSGASACTTLDLFNRLALFEPLSPIGQSEDEWIHFADDENGLPQYQNRRRGTTFSRDAGKTWYDIQDARLNNGDTWYSEEETQAWFEKFDMEYDPTVVLDLNTKQELFLKQERSQQD